MRKLILFATLLATANCIRIADDSSCDSDSDEHYGGHGGRPTVTKKPSPPATKCEFGWTRVKRASGGWCVKVFSGMTNQQQAEGYCAQYGARLSAVESQKERETIVELGKELMISSSGWKIGTLRTGIKRDYFSSPFYSTDGNTQNINNGIKWGGGEPRQGNYDGGETNCAMIWLWVPGGKADPNCAHGDFFTMVCHKSWPDKFRGYVCGKPAV